MNKYLYLIALLSIPFLVFSQQHDAQSPVLNSTCSISLSPTSACGGMDNGTIEVTPGTSSGNLVYSWSGPSSGSITTSSHPYTIPYLASGVYNITFSDGSGCTVTDFTTVINSPTPNISYNSIVQPTCAALGSIDISVSPTGVYIYSWSNGATTQDINNLEPGVYSYNIRNVVSGCLASGGAILNQQFSVTATSNPACSGLSNGSIAVSVTGGSSFDYSWSGPSSGFSTSANTPFGIVGLESGTYQVTVNSNTYCHEVKTVTVGTAPIPVFTGEETMETCAAANDGVVTLFTQGTTTFQYLWSNGQTTQNITGLDAGNYSVTVSDNNSQCSVTQSYLVETDEMSGTPFLLSMSNCMGTMGFETYPPLNQDYYYYGTGGASGNGVLPSGMGSITGLPPDHYFLTLTLQSTPVCSRNLEFDIINYIDLTLSNVLNPTCSGGSNGSATAIDVRDFGTSDWIIFDGNMNQIGTHSGSPYLMTNLSAGNYTIQLTDTTTGCFKQETFSLQNPAPLNININSLNANCLNIGGTATATTSGGQYPYSYLWNNGATSATISGLSTGTYTLTATDANYCTSSNAVTILGSPNPTVVIQSSTPKICSGQQAFLFTSTTGTIGAVTYLWNNAATTASINTTPTANTTYSVTTTDGGMCSAVSSFTVSVTLTPSVTITTSSPTAFCQGGNVVLSASGAPAFTWSNGATTANITAIYSGNYTVTASNGFCSDVKNTQVIVYPAVSVNLQSTSGGCSNNNGSMTAFVSGGISPFTYNWSTGQTGFSISGLSAGNYSTTVTDNNGCSATAASSVGNSAMTVILNGSKTVVCNGESFVLNAVVSNPPSGPINYQWNDPTFTASALQNATPIGTGVKTYIVTASNSGCTATASYSITVNPTPIAAISGTPTFCAGNTTIITASGGGNYLWNGGQTTTALTVGNPGNYSVTVSNNGCSATAGIIVNSIQNPTVSITGNTSFCAGSNTILTASGGGTYLWNGGQTTASITATSAGVYTVTVSNGNCTATASVNVTENALPIPTIAGNTTICSGNSTTLIANGANSYNWSAGLGTNPTSLPINAAGNYWVTATSAAGCTASTSATVTVNPTPIAAISGTPTFCAGNTTIITASGGGNYLWNGGQTTAALTVGNPGNYSVTVSNNGCSATAGIIVNSIQNPTVSITGNTSFCTGSNTILTASGGGTYLWNGGQTTASVTATSAGVYTVTVSNGGCTATASVNVAENALPNPTIAGNTTICSGNSTTLIANGANSYNWSAGLGTNPTSLPINAAGNYSVTATSAAGCTASTSATVTVNPTPIAAISGNQTFCAGNTTVITASGGGNYLWNGGQTTAALTVGNPGNYSVTVSNNGCSATAGIIVNSIQNPTVSITGNTSFCTGSNTILTASGGGTYLWNGGQTTASVTATSAGVYTVTVSNGGCTATATAVVTNSTLSVFILKNDAACGVNNGSLASVVNGGLPPYNYYWTNGAFNSSSPSATGLSAGTYDLTVTDATGCSITQSSTINTINNGNNLPAPTLNTNNVTVCMGTSAELIVTGSGSNLNTVNWYANGNLIASGNAVSDTISVSPNANTVYTVEEISGAGCNSLLATAIVNVTSVPAAPILNDTTICTGQSVTLLLPSPTPWSDIYHWYNAPSGGSAISVGQQFTTPILNNNTVYYISINHSGCQSPRSALNVYVSQPPPPAIVTGAGVYCYGDAIALTAVPIPGTTYFWTSPSGATTNGANLNIGSAVASDNGIYTFTSTNANNCATDVTALVSVLPPLSSTGLFGPSQVCSGGTLPLLADNYLNATYVWTLPDNSTITTSNSNLILPNVTLTGAYSVKIIRGNCQSPVESVWVNVISTPTDPLLSNTNITVCTGDTVSVAVTNNQVGVNYNWILSTGNLLPFATPTLTLNNAQLSDAGVFKVFSSVGNCFSDTISINLTVNATPALPTPTSNAPLCVGETLQLSASSPAGTNVSWTFNGTTVSANIPNVTQSNSGVYTATVIDNLTGCASAPATLDVIVGNVPQSVGINISSPVCEGEDVTLSPDVFIPGAIYNWTGPNGWTSNDYEPDLQAVSTAESGNYQLIISLGNCSSPLSSSNLSVKTPPSIDAGGTVIVEAGSSVQFSATGTAEQFQWIPQSNLDYPFRPNPIFSTNTTDTLEYYVTGSENGNPCSATDTLLVYIIEAQIGEDIDTKPADIITPDGNGVNDTWVVGNIENLRNYTLTIFNRQGMVLFETNEYLNDWAGSFEGKPLPEGTYWYIIATKERVYKGAITIIK